MNFKKKEKDFNKSFVASTTTLYIQTQKIYYKDKAVIYI